MGQESFARSERHGLADDLLAVGPDAPTLCDGWRTRDLAAHVHLRESRPDAALGILGGPTAAWTRRVQGQISAWPYDELVEKVRNGPPLLSPFSLPGADERANLVEFAVHREDVRRAQPDWAPRALPPGLADALWHRARQAARLLVRRSPVGIVFVRTDTGGDPDAPANRLIVRDEEPLVTVSGAALEILLRLYGRRAVRLDVTGNAHAVRAFENLRTGL